MDTQEYKLRAMAKNYADGHIHTARVYLREARARGKNPFAFTLLTWAGNAQRRAMTAEQQPNQPDLFGGTA